MRSPKSGLDRGVPWAGVPPSDSKVPRVYKKMPFIPLAIIGIVVAAATAAQALLIDWLPEAASEQAGRTNTLLWVLFWCSVVFFAIVTTVLIYTIWKFRASDDDLEDGPPINGNTTLEVVWTTIPSLILVIVAVYGYIVLERNEAVAPDRLTVNVYAQQFSWTYGYPEAGIQTGILVVPVGRQVELHVRARDVIHSFWVPDFGIKGDAVPGIDHVLWINPTKVGTFPVVCAELCGVGHSVMRSRVVVLPQVKYDAWLATSRRTVTGDSATAAADATRANAPGDVTAGATTFTSSCGGCHADLGTAAGVGPKLSGLGLASDQIRAQITTGKGLMPGGLVSGTDMANVVAYVTSIQ
ncbi:MAG: cytochrome c oxidase subunit II [Thermoleophilia bacterium]|nr:cytochrome c oxidase subunit II [Thermoleophilia bacterium]